MVPLGKYATALQVHERRRLTTDVGVSSAERTWPRLCQQIACCSGTFAARARRDTEISHVYLPLHYWYRRRRRCWPLAGRKSNRIEPQRSGESAMMMMLVFIYFSQYLHCSARTQRRRRVCRWQIFTLYTS